VLHRATTSSEGEAMLQLLWVPLGLPFLLLGVVVLLGRVEGMIGDRAERPGRLAPRPGGRRARWALPVVRRRPATVAAAEDVPRAV
jgi:hypothetical protein